MNDFTQQLRELRTRLNLSQEELASRLNVSFATVNRWESGKVQPQKAQLDAFNALFDEAGMAHEDTSSRRKRGVHKSEVLSTRSMEQMLWDAACSIRGEKDAAKYKDYILPLLFIKRLSDVFDDEIQRLAETYGDTDTALSILESDHSLVRFYIPKEARWRVVSGRESFDWPAERRPKSLGEQMTTTIRAIVKHNPSLAGVIDIVDYNETRNGEREISDSALRGIIETFSDPRYRLGLHNVEPDFLGRCYEYLLRKFAEGQGQSAGEFFTPTEVGFLMAEIMRPRSGEECYDYACGSFGLLIKLQLICRRLDPLSKLPLRLYGQEREGSSFAIACMNKIIHDMEGEIVRGDSMRNPKFKDNDNRLKKFDIVVANPMWNQPFDQDVYENDPFNRFEQQGGITTSKADWAWLQHTLATLKETGRAAVVLDTGAVTRGSGSKNEDKERNIRKWFVEHDLIDGVILMPDNLFYNTTAAGIIVVLRKNKPKDRKGKIVLVNANQEFKKGAPKNYLTKDGIEKIATAFVKGEAVEGFVKVITNDDVAKYDFDLLPSKYIKNSNIIVHKNLETIKNQIEKINIKSEKIYENLRRMISSLPSFPGDSFPDSEEISLENLDKNWLILELKEIGEIVTGTTPSTKHQEYYGGEYKLISPADLDISKYVTTSHKNLTKLGLDQCRPLPKNTILVGCIGNIGKIGITGDDLCATNQQINAIICKDDFDYQYIYYRLKFDRQRMEQAAAKTTLPILNKANFEKFKILVPRDKTEQSKIARVLSLIDEASSLQESKKKSLSELSQLLLYQLMTYKIRVKNIDIDFLDVN